MTGAIKTSDLAQPGALQILRSNRIGQLNLFFKETQTSLLLQVWPYVRGSFLNHSPTATPSNAFLCFDRLLLSLEAQVT